jgi:hypothetical protein
MLEPRSARAIEMAKPMPRLPPDINTVRFAKASADKDSSELFAMAKA